jgi:hypothetical protein
VPNTRRSICSVAPWAGATQIEDAISAVAKKKKLRLI